MFRKTLCLILALTLIISVAPTITFAADNNIVYEFSSASMDNPYNKAMTEWTNLRDFEVVPEEGTDRLKGNRLTTNKLEEFGNHAIFQIETTGSLWTATANGTTPYASVFTMKVQVPSEGWYGVKLQGAVSQYGADYYIYVNDQYAGLYSFYTEDTSANCFASEEKSLNTLYLTPDSEGKVKIKLCLANKRTYYAGRAYLYRITLSPVSGDVTVAGIESTAPDSLKLGESAEFSSKVRMSDGTLRSFNGYTADASADADNAFAVAAGSSVSLTKTSPEYAHDGEYTASLATVSAGDAEIKTTATVGGVKYSEKKSVWVLNADGTTPSFTILFDKNNFKFNDKERPSADWETIGFDIVLDKTANYIFRSYGMKVDGGEYGIIYPQAVQTRSGPYSVWYSEVPGTANRINNMFTISKNIPEAGYYDIDFRGFKWYAGSQYSVYVDGKYAGDVNSYDKDSNPSITFGDVQNLNRLYLPKGKVEISFCSRKAYYDTALFLPYYLKFTPASEYTVSGITSDIPATLESGASVNLTASVNMSDGSLRQFGYLLDGKSETDPANIIKVTSSASDIVAVSNVVCVEPQTAKDLTQVINPAVTKYTLMAGKAGSADIMVTAVVDGKETKKTVSVTVPSADPSEEAPVAKFMAASEGADAKITTNITGYTKGTVADVDLGTKVSVTAEDAEGYTFKYWKTNAGYVSANKTFTFTMASNTALFAVYEKNDETSGIKVDFFNGNGELIETRSAEEGALLSAVGYPGNPTMTGYTFEGWSLDGDTVISKDTQVVALYSEEGIAVDGLVIDGEAKTDARYGKLYTAIAEDTRDGKQFRYWMKDQKCVSFNKTYSFYAWGAAEIAPMYGDEEVEKLPSAVLDKNGNGYMLEYDVPEGFTKVEAGIIFGGSSSITVDRCYSKAVSRRDSSHGQFTAQPSGNGTETYARGYVIYMSGADYRIIYSD